LEFLHSWNARIQKKKRGVGRASKKKKRPGFNIGKSSPVGRVGEGKHIGKTQEKPTVTTLRRSQLKGRRADRVAYRGLIRGLGAWRAAEQSKEEGVQGGLVRLFFSKSDSLEDDRGEKGL